VREDSAPVMMLPRGDLGEAGGDWKTAKPARPQRFTSPLMGEAGRG